MANMAAHYATGRVYRMAGLAPAEIDAMELYDGFTMITMNWIEAFGFCARGEAGPYVEGGDRIRLGGERPLNTHGGQLSEGRIHGMGQVTEAAWQLRGEYAGTVRQIEGVRNIAVGIGGGPLAAAAIFTNDPQG
jgi:acetyl-CoA acetyltransferase